MDEGSLQTLGVLIIHCSVVWVRAHYLSLALSPSHDFSSTFIRKPSAPLAKQRKKGGNEGVLHQTLCHIYHSYPSISPFLWSTEQNNLSKMTLWGLRGCWDGVSPHTGGSQSSSAQTPEQRTDSLLNKWGERAHFMVFPCFSALFWREDRRNAERSWNTVCLLTLSFRNGYCG